MRRRELLAGVAASAFLAKGTTGLPFANQFASDIPCSALATERPAFGSRPVQPVQESVGRVKPVEELVTPKTVTAIERGLRFLANRQLTSGPFAGAFGTSGYASGPAVTGLAGLAFMCNGSTPFDGPYQANLRRCTEYMLKHTSDKGYITAQGNQQSNMYGHGYGMLYLSQVFGMDGSREVEDKLRMAVDMTCKVQNNKGGWRYQPAEQEGDLSITICQIMALRAAHDAGMFVSEEVRDKTLDYVYKSQKKDGSFQYMLRGGRVSLALTAAGVVSLYSAGIYEGEKVEKALKWIYDRKPTGRGGGPEVSPMNYYYAHYYAVQAMWHAQMQHPDYWNGWYPAIREELLGKSRDGIWDDQRVCREFATAMCCIILQIPYNFVPVFSP